MSYRPITDVWILARPKVKYYGAYPSGFLGRARALLGVTLADPLLHVCGGSAKLYPAASGPGLGLNDCTLDIDPETKPDLTWDVRDKRPLPAYGGDLTPWPAILADPPYTEADSAKYRVDALAISERPSQEVPCRRASWWPSRDAALRVAATAERRRAIDRVRRRHRRLQQSDARLQRLRA